MIYTLITLTNEAVDAAKFQLLKRGTQNSALRIGLKGGGCSGFSYVFEFDDKDPHEKDHVFDFDGLRVFIDQKSMTYLSGCTLDWEKSLMWTGFKFKNPHEKTSCGCGKSFSVV